STSAASSTVLVYGVYCNQVKTLRDIGGACADCKRPFGRQPHPSRASANARHFMPDAPSPTFESALAELESIVERMEGGELPLKDALAAYKRGAELLQFCQATLKDAQQQVLVLEKGVLKAFEGDADEA